MKKTIVLIDGENFKHKLADVFTEARKQIPAWHEYDFKTLFAQVLSDVSLDQITVYFSRIKEHPETREKSRKLIEEQRLLKNHLEDQGFNVVLSGRVRGQYEQGVLVFKEKGVDVQIAVDMVQAAHRKDTDTIIIGSSDSDLQPAIAAAKEHNITTTYLGFETQPNKGLTYTTNRTILIRNTEVLENN